MSNHHLFGRPEPDFGDSAFEPRSSYDFEEEVDHSGHSMAAFQAFSTDDMDFNMGEGAYGENGAFDQEYFRDRDSPMTAPNLFQSPRMPEVGPKSMSRKAQVPQNFNGARANVSQPSSSQSNIVDSRSKHVSQQFGQITPPNENGLESFKAPPAKHPQPQRLQSHDSGKLTNEQRARNAANTRHSRSKNAKKTREQAEGNSDDEGAQKQGKNITVQREKNRVAAAKCRAKKKSANEQQEELASEYGATNNYLTREIRELKNQKSELQNFLLAHRPGMCECHGIHDYNLGQAQRLVLNARRHAVEQASSPSRESDFSTQSPGSEESIAGMFPASDRVSPSDTLSMPPRYPSFGGPLNYVVSQDMHSQAMQTGAAAAREGQHMSHDFAEFLKSSPDGRAGFS